MVRKMVLVLVINPMFGVAGEKKEKEKNLALIFLRNF